MSKLLKFILKISFLASMLVGAYILVIYGITKKSDFDYNYSKFTHKGGSLIIGISRAHYGINPEIIEKEFKNDIKLPVLNFALQKTQSSYGEVLLNSIKKKIDTNSSKNGLFILSVNPGSFLISKNVDIDKDIIDENTNLYKVKNLNTNPNFEYIRKCFESSLYQGFTIPQSKFKKFHDNGWAEFKDDNLSNNTISVRKNILTKRQKKQLPLQKFSEYRVNKFKETIEYLKKHGQVVLVRLPFDDDFVKIEDNAFINFNKDMTDIAQEFNVPFFNYTLKKEKYKTYDGSHLTSKSAIKFTEQLCEDIKKYQQQ